MRELSDSTQVARSSSRQVVLETLLPPPDLMRALKVVVFDSPLPAARRWTATTLAVQALRFLGNRTDDQVRRLRTEALVRPCRSRLRPSPHCWEIESAAVLAKIAEASRLIRADHRCNDDALDECLAEAVMSLARASTDFALAAQRRRDDAERVEELREEKMRTSDAARARSRKRWHARDVAREAALDFAGSLTAGSRAAAARGVVRFLERRGCSVTVATADRWLRDAHWAPALRTCVCAADTPSCAAHHVASATPSGPTW